MPVTKVIEVIGTSDQGSDDAVREAVTAAGRSIRGISAVEVVSVTCDVEDGNIARWNALVKLVVPGRAAVAPPYASAAGKRGSSRIESRSESACACARRRGRIARAASRWASAASSASVCSLITGSPASATQAATPNASMPEQGAHRLEAQTAEVLARVDVVETDDPVGADRPS